MANVLTRRSLSGAVVAVLTFACFGSGVHAEGVEKRLRIPSSFDRVHGADGMKPMPGGGWVSIGGSMLRVLAPGAKSWETLLRIPGDSVYRVAVSESGAILAAYEKDPSLHYFLPGLKQHSAIPRPSAPAEVFDFHPEFIDFLPNRREAVVLMYGRKPHMDGPYHSHHPYMAMYRVALDGHAAPQQLYAVEGGKDLYASKRVAVFAVPRKLGQVCEDRTCAPVEKVVAYELSEQGVTEKTLLSSAQLPMSNVRIVWGSDDRQLMFMLMLQGQERALFYWKPGTAHGATRPFVKENYLTERFHLLDNGELLELVQVNDFKDLEVRRHAWTGKTSVTMLRGTTDRNSWDRTVHGVGVRGDGTLWLHWGDNLMLLAEGKPVRAYDLEPLITRGTEWAGADLYLDRPETLWVGLDIRAGRDFAKVDFADVERRATPWPFH